jgi:hypothetical protein
VDQTRVGQTHHQVAAHGEDALHKTRQTQAAAH